MTEEIKKVEEVAPKLDTSITIQDFAKCDIRIGKILNCETIDGADKLYKFTVDVGEVDTEGKGVTRTILSGIREFYTDGAVLIGRCVPVLTNLKPRVIRGVESNGMILYAVGEGHVFLHTLSPEVEVKVGTRVQ
jgi:methionyl-tRNA synthetase